MLYRDLNPRTPGSEVDDHPPRHSRCDLSGLVDSAIYNISNRSPLIDMIGKYLGTMYVRSMYCTATCGKL